MRLKSHVGSPWQTEVITTWVLAMKLTCARAKGVYNWNLCFKDVNYMLATGLLNERKCWGAPCNGLPWFLVLSLGMSSTHLRSHLQGLLSGKYSWRLHTQISPIPLPGIHVPKYHVWGPLPATTLAQRQREKYVLKAQLPEYTHPQTWKSWNERWSGRKWNPDVRSIFMKTGCFRCSHLVLAKDGYVWCAWYNIYSSLQ